MPKAKLKVAMEKWLAMFRRLEDSERKYTEAMRKLENAYRLRDEVLRGSVMKLTAVVIESCGEVKPPTVKTDAEDACDNEDSVSSKTPVLVTETDVVETEEESGDDLGGPGEAVAVSSQLVAGRREEVLSQKGGAAGLSVCGTGSGMDAAGTQRSRCPLLSLPPSPVIAVASPHQAVVRVEAAADWCVPKEKHN